jgi:hypothetical protein
MAARPATGPGREWPIELVGGPKDGDQFIVRTTGKTPPPEVIVPLPMMLPPLTAVTSSPAPRRTIGVYKARSYLHGGTPDMTRLKYDWAGEKFT